MSAKDDKINETNTNRTKFRQTTPIPPILMKEQITH